MTNYDNVGSNVILVLSNKVRDGNVNTCKIADHKESSIYHTAHEIILRISLSTVFLPYSVYLANIIIIAIKIISGSSKTEAKQLT